MDSTGEWTTAVDPDVVELRGPTRAAAPSCASASAFGAGLAAGVLVAVIAGQLWLARHLEVLALFVGDVELKSLSRLAVSPLWRYGVPIGFGAVFFVLLGLRVRATAVWTTVAVAAIATLVLTHIWAFAALD